MPVDLCSAKPVLKHVDEIEEQALLAEDLERKLQFLKAHPHAELDSARAERTQALDAWNGYTDAHKAYAKLAKTVAVVRGPDFKKAQESLEKAQQNVARLERKFAEAGIGPNETSEHLQAELVKAQSALEAMRFEREIFPALQSETSLESCEKTHEQIVRALDKSQLLLPEAKTSLKASLERLYCQKMEQVFTDTQITPFSFEKLKSDDFAKRKWQYQSILGRLELMPFKYELKYDLRHQIDRKYLQIERLAFESQELTKLDYRHLNLGTQEELSGCFGQILDLIPLQYGKDAALCTEFIMQATVLYEKSMLKIKRQQEIAPLYRELVGQLSFFPLIAQSLPEREKLFAEIMAKLGTEYQELKLPVQHHYQEVLREIDVAQGHERVLLKDWNEEALISMEDELIQYGLQDKLKQIAQLPEELINCKGYLRSKAQSIAQTTLVKKGIQHLPIQLRNLPNATERFRCVQHFQENIPMVHDRQRLEHEVEVIHRHTEMEIQLSKMSAALEILKQSPLDIHEEVKQDVPVQEAEIELQKLFPSHLVRKSAAHTPRHHPLLSKWKELKESHHLVLEENHLIREAVQHRGATKLLSFEAQKRAMPWIAANWYCRLRTDEVLSMLGIEPLPPGTEGNFSYGLCEYHLTPMGRELLKDYAEEAAKLHKAHQHPTWLTQIIRDDIRDTLAKLG
ncbi:MAG: hypothetical protein V4534_02100 [Myxococcota bacterium]